MPCICSGKLNALAGTLCGLTPPNFIMPPRLSGLAGMMNGALAASLGASAASLAGGGAGLAIGLGNLSLLGSVATSATAGLGINLSAPNAQAGINMTMGAFNANAAAFRALASLNPAPWMKLSGFASLNAQLQGALGLNIAAGNVTSAQLGAALSGGLPGLPGMGAAHATGAAAAGIGISPASAALALGIPNLSAPRAAAALSATANGIAGLSVPALSIPLAGLMNALSMLHAMSNISMHLGLNVLAPGFHASVAMMSAGLSAFVSLSLPASGLALGAAAASLSMSAGLSAALSGLAGLSLGGLGSLGLVADFALAAKAVGFPVVMVNPCQVCPLKAALSAAA